jgi:hypothetical protein
MGDLPLTDQPLPNERLPIAVAVVVFTVLSLVTGFASDAFLEADAVLHYLYARFAIAEPFRLVDVWGRPVCTAYYAIPAFFFGRAGTRVASLALALLVGWLAYRIARRQGHARPALAMIFTFAQPLVFAHSFSELTELPFAVLFAGAFAAYQLRQFAALALLASLTPLCRPEGFGVVLVAMVALTLHRKWASLPLVMLGLVGWTHAGWTLFGRQGSWLLWLPDHWPYATESAYTRGHPLHFIAALPAVVSPLVFPATITGIALGLSLLKRPVSELYQRFTTDHRFRCELLIVLIPLGVTAVHGLLYWRGKMASNGELRYLLTVAPFWGLLAGAGWMWLCRFFRIRCAYVVAAVVCAFPMVVNQAYYRVFPLRPLDDWKMAKAVATWLANPPPDASHRPRVIASHPGIYYFLDISPTDGTRVVELNSNNIASPPPGTRLIFDDLYATHNADRDRVVTESTIVAAGWVPDESLQRAIDCAAPAPTTEPAHPLDGLFSRGPTRWRAYVSPR